MQNRMKDRRRTIKWTTDDHFLEASRYRNELDQQEKIINEEDNKNERLEKELKNIER